MERLKKYSAEIDKIFAVVWTKTIEAPISHNNELFIYPTNSKHKINYIFNTLKICKKIIKDNKIDLISTQDSFETGFAGWIISKFFHIPLQLQIHTDFSSLFFRKESLLNKIRFLLAKFLIPRADCFRVVSRRLKNKLIGEFNIDEEKIAVIPIFAEIGNLKLPARQSLAGGEIGNLEKERRDKFVFLTVGRLVLVKNIEMQIKAVFAIMKEYSNIELWVVGEGQEKGNLKLEIRNLGLEKNVKLLGWHDDLEKFYRQADVFLLSSNYEGWGMAVIEAASCGLPIIMTDVGCAGEAIKNNESGIVIPVGNQKKLEDAMIKLIKNSELRKKLGENARQAVLKLPSKEESLELYKKSWEKALTKN